MRLFWRLSFVFFTICYVQQLQGQGCFSTGLNGTVINLPCGSNCSNLQVRVPHLKSTDNYQVVNIPYTPYPYTTSSPALNIPPPCSQDDRFFDTTILPFRFCFFERNFGRLVIGTNGVITFDSTNALRGNNYTLNSTTKLPFAGTGFQGSGTCPTPSGSLFPRAAIMGVYYDIFPRSTDPDYKIEARVEGTAPCRRFIVSYFNIPPFGCTSLRGSSQIVIYENTGLIEVYIENKPDCNSNNGLAVLGIQNWERNKGLAAPGKNGTRWSESNTAYRFIPSGVTSRFIRSEIYDLAGTLLQTTTSDTATTTPGMLNLNFSNICFTGASKQFIVKTYFSPCPAGAEIMTSDVITVNKGNLTSTSSSTPASCSANGTATITLPAGQGPYNFVLGTNAPVSSPNNTFTFTGLISGTYTLTGTNAAGCSASATVTVALNGSLNVQSTPTATSCSGLNDGSIVISLSYPEPG